MLLQQFQRTRLNADGARIGIGLHRAVDEPHGNVRARETHGGGEPGWPRPDDQHR